MSEPGAAALRRLQTLAVAAAAMAAFATSATNPFIPWDDNLYVTANPRVQRAGLEGLSALWSSQDVWEHRFIEFFPLRDTVYWATWQLFGDAATAFHLVNIAAHALVAVLVLMLGRRLRLPDAAAFWGALLFAVHPIHVESVTWVAALKDPMFTGFMLGSVVSFLSYREHRRARDYVLCVVLMVAALWCKSLALSTPVLLLVLERWLEPRESWRTSLVRVAGPGLIALGFLVQFTLMGKINGVVVPPHGGSWGQHVFLMSWALVRYVQQVVAPTSFRIHHCFEPLEGALDVRLVAIAVVLVAIVVAVRFAWRRQRVAGLLIVWFFACLLPVANVVPFPAIMADRYLYAPSVAACLLLGWGLTSLGERRRWVVLAVTLVFGGVTLARGVVWRDHRNLWAEAIEDDACLKDGLTSAVMMYLNHAQWTPDAESSLAAFEKALAHPKFGALRVEERALYLRQGQERALSLGRRDLALRWSDEAVRLAPRDPKVWLSRVAVLSEPKAALEAAEQAFRLERSADTFWTLGLQRLANGQAVGANDLLSGLHLAPRKYCAEFLRLLGGQLSAYRAELELPRQQCEAGLARDAARGLGQ